MSPLAGVMSGGSHAPVAAVLSCCSARYCTPLHPPPTARRPAPRNHRWQQIHAFFACAAYLQSQTADSIITIFQKTSIKMHIIRSKTCSTLKEWDSTLLSSILGPSSALQRSQIVLNISIDFSTSIKSTKMLSSNFYLLKRCSLHLHMSSIYATDLRVDLLISMFLLFNFTNIF